MLTLGRTTFCSDFHLQGSPQQHPAIAKFFLSAPSRCDNLVILGDLFDCWWGDDHCDEAYQAWEAFFADLPIPHYLLCGNRDFLVGQDFYKRTGFIPLESGALIQIGDMRIGLLHGDEPGLCDPWYQVWRRVVRHKITQKLFLTLPERMRRSFAGKIRENREKETPRQPTALPIEMKKWFSLFPSPPEIMINGHLHYPMVEELDNGIVRYQLGCWDEPNTSWITIDPSGLIDARHSGPQMGQYVIIQDEQQPESL